MVKRRSTAKLFLFLLTVSALLVPLMLSNPAFAQAANIFVDPTSPGTQTGGSWENAYHKLADAFDDAFLNSILPVPVPSIIHVAQGVYKPDEDEVSQFPPTGPDHVNNDRNESFLLVPNLVVRGGFPPGGAAEPSPSQFVTVLSGDIGDLPGDVDSHDPVPFTNMGENSIHVLKRQTGSGGGDILVDGCTITGGNADGATTYDNTGGGVLLNTVDGPTVCTFRRCIFTRNTSDGAGGAIYATERVGITLLKSLIVDNRTLGESDAFPLGGGGLASSSSIDSDDALRVLDSEFLRNVAVNGNGGGVATTTFTKIISSSFTDNAADSGSGGGVWASGGTSVINSVFQGNDANGSSPDGRGGGAFISSQGSVTVNSTFAENIAREVGGLHTAGPVRNCILFFNDATGGLLTCPGGGSTIAYSDQINPAALPTESCIENWTWSGSWPCGGGTTNPLNIASDPNFRSLTLGNLRLQGDSLCIDNGQDSFVPLDEEDVDESMTTSEPTPDRDLHVRIQDGGISLDVDMGAYEYTPLDQCPADFNDDDTVDGMDLAILLAAWGECDSCPEDLNEDGQVTGLDLAILLAAWGRCGESLMGGGGESSSSSESSGEDECGGSIELFQQWLESADMETFMAWLDCTLGL